MSLSESVLDVLYVLRCFSAYLVLLYVLLFRLDLDYTDHFLLISLINKVPQAADRLLTGCFLPTLCKL